MIGTKVAHYEITSHLGSGGMGDVYQASDSKLGRDVAIKFLPESFARDDERVARFDREARVLASMNHPNIAAIYAIEQAASRKFLVMELVGGETLAERIKRGPLPIDEALGIAKQICEALEAAHDKGIIHRDLKPANIKVTPDGKVKVLDFGLAKAVSGANASPAGRSHQIMDIAPSAGALSNSPTKVSMAGTNPGIILGTASYMSPEQAKGRSVDKRTDIFAFGCVLYEMLAGKPAFDGEDVAEILSRVLQREPDWTLLPAATPSEILKLLSLCLEKNPTRRRRDAGDILIDIDLALTQPGGAAESVSRVRKRAGFAWILTSGLLALALASLAMVHFREKPPATPPEWKFDIATPDSTSPLSFALSPDGRSIVYVASGSGESKLWLRRLDQTEAHALAGTEGAITPFWSPDSKSIGFVADNQLKRVDVDGGALAFLASGATGYGGTWNASGVIVFAGRPTGLLRIPDSGGQQPEIMTGIGPAETGIRWPQFLPDGRHFIFHTVLKGTGSNGTYLASLDGSVQKRLGPADTGAKWLPPDRLVFVQQGRLVARRLDLSREELVGDPEIIADAVGTGFNFQGGFSVSTAGGIAYRSGSSAGSQQLVWLDRAGKPAGKPLDPDVRDAIAPEISPDGKRVALDRTAQGNRDVWLLDLVRGGMKRLTSDPAVDGFPVWSFNGSQVAFESGRSGNLDIYIKPSNGGVEQPLLPVPGGQWPMSFSRGGKFLLYFDTGNSGELLALPLSSDDRKPIPVATTARTGTFSPDGRWVAYEKTQCGRFEVVVQAFPNPTETWQVSATGGTYPRWSANGKELYFISNNRLMAASVRTSGSSFEYDTPVELFQSRFAIEGTPSGRPPYDVSPDGRFLMNQVLETSTNAITILLNWKPK